MAGREARHALEATAAGLVVNDPLFRTEALDQYVHERGGSVNVAVPVAHSAWTAAGVLLLATFALVLYFGSYQRRERAMGILVPDAGQVDVQAPTNGYISGLKAREGSQVSPATIVMVLSGELESQALGETQAAVSGEIRAQLDELDRESMQATAAAAVQASQLSRQAELAHQDLARIAAQRKIAAKQLAASDDVLSRLYELSKDGYASDLQVKQQEQASLDLQMKIESLKREAIATTARIDDIGHSLKGLPISVRQKLSEIDEQKAKSRQELAESELRRRMSIRPPTRGTITAMLVRNNQYVKAGQPLYSMRPSGSAVEAQLFLPSSAIGFVNEGDRVLLHTPAFPYQKYGSQSGRVRAISDTALAPAEVASLLGIQPPQQALYRVIVRLDQKFVVTERGHRDFQPGMTVEADLLLERRRFYEWLFEPLLGFSRR
jgi:membrane fusion protein